MAMTTAQAPPRRVKPRRIKPRRIKPRRIKVVHLVVAGDIGGAERLLVDLASRPQESGADHCIALMTPNPRLREMFTAAGLAVRDRGSVRENPIAYLVHSWGPADVGWLERILAEEAAELIHVHTFASHVLGVRAALRRRIPVLRTEHGIRHYRDPSCWPFRRWALDRTDAVVAVSGFVARFLSQHVPHAASKLSVVRNGVDAAFFRPQPPPHPGPFTFCVVSRLEPWKRIDMVLRAIARIPQVRVHIAGDGSARMRLERLAVRLRIADRVRFLGYVGDPRPVLAESNAAVNSSREEPLGLSILEALSTQRPVVAFAQGGVPEILRHRDTGWLVHDPSVDALAASLTEASASVEQAALFGANGRAFVEQQCRIEMMCDGYARRYADLAGQRCREARA